MRASRWLATLCLLPLLAMAEPPSSAPLFAASVADSLGKPVALAQYKGKPLVVNFWARWCGPCRNEIPLLSKLYKDHRKQGVEVLGIAVEDNIEAVRDFAKAYEMDYPVLVARDQGLQLMSELGNARQGLPFTIAVDARGKVVMSKLGGISESELIAAVEASLK